MAKEKLDTFENSELDQSSQKSKISINHENM